MSHQLLSSYALLWIAAAKGPPRAKGPPPLGPAGSILKNYVLLRAPQKKCLPCIWKCQLDAIWTPRGTRLGRAGHDGQQLGIAKSILISNRIENPIIAKPYVELRAPPFLGTLHVHLGGPLAAAIQSREILGQTLKNYLKNV